MVIIENHGVWIFRTFLRIKTILNSLGTPLSINEVFFRRKCCLGTAHVFNCLSVPSTYSATLLEL